MLLLEHARTLDGAAADPGLRLRPRRRRDQDGARRHLSRRDHRRRLRRAAAALFRERAARLSRAARTARDGAVCAARPAEGRAVFADGSGLLPQPADLSERAKRSRARSTSFTLRCARRAPVSRHRRNRSTSGSALFSVIDKKYRIYCAAAHAPHARCRCRSDQRAGARAGAEEQSRASAPRCRRRTARNACAVRGRCSCAARPRT